MLVDLAVGSAELFHTATGIAYADLVIDGHRETLAGPQPTLSGLVTAPKFEAASNATSAPALNSALNLLEARAQFEGPEQAVRVRIAEHDGHIYLDLADKTWRSVDVGPDGWRVVEEPRCVPADQPGYCRCRSRSAGRKILLEKHRSAG